MPRSPFPLLAALAGLAVLTPAASAAAPTFERTLYPVGERPRAVAAGQLDAGSDLDLAVANLFSDDVSVLRGGAGATFAAAQPHAVAGEQPGDIAVGDIDGDGDDDAITVDGNTFSISLLVGDGAGGFAPAVGIPVIDAQRVAMGDLDEDGRADVVVTSANGFKFGQDQAVSVFFGRADGRLSAPTVLTTKQPYAPELIDVNADGHLDLVMAERPPEVVTVRLGDGNGSFSAPAGFPTSQLGPEVVAAADYDGDGDVDLAVGYGSSNVLDILSGNGDGTFAAAVPRVIAGATSALEAGDLDRDGRVDLVHADATRVNVLRNAADGWQDQPLEPGSPGPRDVVLGDFDADGWLDLASANLGTTTAPDPLNPDQVAVFRNTSAPAPEPEPEPVPQLPFAGFFAPVDNLPVANAAQAGRAIPVRFSLGGDRGLDVFAAGYPRSEQLPCDSSATVDGIEETASPGTASLTYDDAADRYQYVWQTAESWAGQCRQLVVKLRDGSSHRANFRLR